MTVQGKMRLDISADTSLLTAKELVRLILLLKVSLSCGCCYVIHDYINLKIILRIRILLFW